MLMAFVMMAGSAMAAGPEGACLSAIEAVQRGGTVPPGLLGAIARTESGRAVPGGRVVPWPWTINAAGTGHFYESAEAAIAAVGAFRAAGIQSIDVGCMQVNLLHHPTAFTSLQQAFDPAANAAYAAKFLTGLRTELGNWPRAVQAYHSRTPELAVAYGRRVLGDWPGAPPAAPPPPVVADRWNVYTPEFKQRLAHDAAERAERDRRLLGRPEEPPREVAVRTRRPGTRLAFLEPRRP